jgi:hypothetical protein
MTAGGSGRQNSRTQNTERRTQNAERRTQCDILYLKKLPRMGVYTTIAQSRDAILLLLLGIEKVFISMWRKARHSMLQDIKDDGQRMVLLKRRCH